jgi:predicted ribosome quality control (RQC) complex YloA/Tae2 family protein
MHNNYYFLRKLSAELETRILGTVVSECFSQNKDELIIRFETETTPLFIKASLKAEFCCLSFPLEFNRARKNSVDLFELLIGQRVEKITQFTNERSFAIEFSNEVTLLFKMHGNRANLILFENDNAIELFRNHLITDAEIKLEELNRKIDWSNEAFEKNIHELHKHYFTFGKAVWNFLNRNNFDEKSDVEKWLAIKDLIVYLERPTYYITEIDHHLNLSLFPDGNLVKKFTSAIQAIDEFYLQFTRNFSLTHEKQAILSTLRTKVQNGISYLKKAHQKKKEIEKDTHYKTWADLLMANLHQVKPGDGSIILSDFHTNKPVEIKLKKDLSPQKNAEIFYRKSKNQLIEIQKLTEGIIRKEKEVSGLLATISAIENTLDLKALRTFMESSGLNQEAAKKEKPLPYHEVDFNGFKIWIGKNAQHNDTLTLKHTFKDDLWLHAKDVPGSHVVIKYQSGKKFPKDVIERAAQLAAYNSKRKTDSLCPVAYTPKKFVRKRKGDPAGAVVVEREEVILVEPKS